MKKLMIITLVLSLFLQKTVNAQVSVTVNIGSQPQWGPVGYDYVDYYYMPDIDAYYNVPEQQFIYLESNRWVFGRALPPRFSWYDPYRGYKVVVNEPRPYLHADVYRVKYGKYKGGKGPKQVIIRDSHDNRYKNNGPGHYKRDNGNGKSKGNGKGKGHGKHH